MNRLEIPNGGMPFTGDDLMWMQDGLIEAINSLAVIAGDGGNMVLRGCEVDYTYVHPGIVYIEGELMKFLGGTIPAGINSQDLVLVREDVYDPSGLESFADAVSRNTYKISHAALADKNLHTSYARLDTLYDYKTEFARAFNRKIRDSNRSKTLNVTINGSGSLIATSQGQVKNIQGQLDGFAVNAVPPANFGVNYTPRIGTRPCSKIIQLDDTAMPSSIYVSVDAIGRINFHDPFSTNNGELVAYQVTAPIVINMTYIGQT